MTPMNYMKADMRTKYGRLFICTFTGEQRMENRFIFHQQDDFTGRI